MISLPQSWNGYGYVPDPNNGAHLIEGEQAGYDAYGSLLWCKTLTSCKETP